MMKVRYKYLSTKIFLLIIIPIFCVFNNYCNRGKTISDSTEQQIRFIKSIDITDLYHSINSETYIDSLDIIDLSKIANSLIDNIPLWPVYIILIGETYLNQGDTIAAKKVYRILVELSAKDIYGDGWGVSGLSSLALLRWLKLVNSESKNDSNEVDQIINLSEKILETRLNRRIFKTRVLSSLPQLEEEILKQLSILTWFNNKKHKALRVFLNYLNISRSSDYDSLETILLDTLISSETAELEYINLLRGKRLYSLGKYDYALKEFNDLLNCDNLAVRHESIYYYAKIKKNKGTKRGAVIELLNRIIENSTDQRLLQSAIFDRALLYNREGHNRNIKLFKADLEKLIENYPNGNLTDDARYLLARHYQRIKNYDKALDYFYSLQNYEGPNDWLNLPYFQSALTLYLKGEKKDLESAIRLLKELEKLYPNGPLHLSALFWLGRIKSDIGHRKEAKQFYHQIIEEAPYSYYSIRARMHLNLGEKALKKMWPDSTTKQELAVLYQDSKIDSQSINNTIYGMRIQDALKQKLYSNSLYDYGELRKKFPNKRLEDIPIGDLEKNNFLLPVSILLSLRQDAMAAIDSDTTKIRLRLANLIGTISNDWSFCMDLVIASSIPYEIRWSIQQDESYLLTAYPDIYHDIILDNSDKYQVQPELLYSVMRRESMFYPEALSTSGALGLFQFTEYTFKSLDNRWNLLNSSGIKSMYEYLFNSNLNIELGARWFELLKRHNENVLFALMEHNAGYPAVERWIRYWKNINKYEDIEFMIESIRFLETRIFMRNVLTDMYISSASSLFALERID